MKKIKMGVLGVSNHLIKRIILPLQQLSNCTIVAIASRESDKASQLAGEYNIPVVCKSYNDLLANAEVDAVYIPLPNHLHAEWAIKAMEAGKPVLCEKPLGMDVSEAKKMSLVSQKSGIPLMEGFMYKYHPLWKHVKNIVKTGQIGSIVYIHTSFSYNNPSPSNIRNIKEFGGGGLMDIGCYAVSVPRFITGLEPVKVMSLISEHPEFGTDMHTSGILDFGISRASFHVSTASEPFQKVDIVGSSGSITIHIPFNTYVDVPSSINVSTNQGSRNVEFPVCDPYGLMFEEFSYALLNKRPMTITILDAINNMVVIDALRTSAVSGAWVKID
jgi:predicted dehydrogenase